MAITKEQVFEIADQLHEAGENPTLAKVRNALGGGSYTTISEFMGEWKTQQQNSQTLLRDPAPEAISRRLTELGSEIWATAQEQANARLTSERESLAATRQELEASQKEATELADQLSNELEAAQQQQTILEQTQQGTQHHLEQLQQENTELKQQLATHEARAGEMDKHIADLKAELQKAQTEREQAQQTASDSREKAAHLQGELTATQAQNTALLGSLKKK